MTSAIIASENASSMTKPVRRMRFASSGLPSPMRIPISGDAPHDIHTAAEPTMVTTRPADAHARQRRFTRARDVADVHSVHNTVQHAHKLRQHARQRRAPNQRANVVAAEVIFSFHLSRFLFYPLRTALNTPAGFIVFKFTDEAIRFFLVFYYIFFPRKHQPRGPAFPFRAVFLNCFSHVA